MNFEFYKRLFKDFGRILNTPIFIVNTLSLLAMCTILFQLRDVSNEIMIGIFWITFNWFIWLFQTMMKHDYIALHQALTANFFILQLFFSFCYLGDQMTSKALQVNESIYCSEWYNYSTNMQMLLIIIMKRSQKPYILNGYSLVYLSLKSFKEVRILTYLMIHTISCLFVCD